MRTPESDKLQRIATVVTTKRSRSLVFLIITFLVILLVNGLLPVVSGRVHYTSESIELTYGEYLSIKENDKYADLTYGSKVRISVYEEAYRKAYPDLTPEELVTIPIPNDLVVSMYTRFFFESPWWYISTVISLISAVILYYAIFNYLIVRAKDTRADYVNNELKIKQLNEKYLDPDTFEPWLEDDFNRKRKIKQHTLNVKHALRVLETKTDYIIRRRFKSYFEELKKRPETPADNLLPAVYVEMSEAERNYLNRKEELLGQLTDEYINDNVIYMDIKNFKAIRAGFVYSGIDSSNVGSDEYTAIATDGKRIRESMLSRVLMALAFTFAFATLFTIVGVDMEAQSPLWIVIAIVTKILPLLLQVYFAINYSTWFMDNQLLPNLSYREKIAFMYLAEMKRQGKIKEHVVIEVINIGGEKDAKKD